ncbi:cupin domain-containing protein [Aureispira anguillae]|uniref:Cupin domain-containing protein n=1 Tax=Aureispira anguillae TaxID=2864201 RepID=A0A915YLD7_9BACT|nr:cupin domain-containing protein [Aureispira anguillae]BDS15225.1 cupin domain-containing protein [Aureispira anguillae]
MKTYSEESLTLENKFAPNKATFQEGLDRIQQAIKETQTRVGNKIITSQDEDSIKLANLLATDNVPQGFKKWQLPFAFEQSQFFISIGNPDISVPEHSHDEGDGVRFIISGSIYYKDQELKAGDWMYIPQGEKYEIKTGPFGVVMGYCYQCCCAIPSLNKSDKVVLEGNPFVK